jgi:ubiquinone/menaquinone biosynthesis C-methylase UbiE
MKWIYRHPSVYNFVDSAFSLSLADRVRRKVFDRLRPSSLLEIGVGSGKNMVMPVSPVKVGVDISLDMLEYARSRFRDVGLVVCDAVSLPLRNDTFELSVFCYVLRGLAKPRDAVREALRVSSRVVIIDYDRPFFIPGFLWDNVINRIGRVVFGSKDLDFAAIEKLGASKEVLKYYGGLYRVIILDA